MISLIPTMMQQASAQKTQFDFEQIKENRCSAVVMHSMRMVAQ